jgi:hypothetical protein
VIISLNGDNQLIFVMVKCGVLFEVRTEFLNIISTSFGFKGLNTSLKMGSDRNYEVACYGKYFVPLLLSLIRQYFCSVFIILYIIVVFSIVIYYLHGNFQLLLTVSTVCTRKIIVHDIMKT